MKMSVDSTGEMILIRKNTRTEKKPVPVPLRLPQISHDMARGRTWVSAVRDRSLNRLSHGKAFLVEHQVTGVDWAVQNGTTKCNRH
jgi:hypothetical protein